MSANCMLLELCECAATCDNAWRKPTAIRSSRTCRECRKRFLHRTTRMESWIKHTKKRPRKPCELKA